MRIWDSIEEVATSLANDAKAHEHERDRYKRILDAKGDASVVGGWGGRMRIGDVKAAIVREDSYAKAKTKAAYEILQCLRQNAPRRKGIRSAEDILRDLLQLRATEGREPVIELYREAERILSS